ncbi:MBL fold metallo-hydrolase [Conexibacter sp. DBS9H8]|uniref:MBL fold metallo-hydrolase n=1 Tax=Conexibacter sp. DBS9H8 TaxID=2937801 RepID=UPI00200C2B0B|nr:MBL fold metallo-hydrolase [Conexibacter sp. DBS9H8]
MASSSETARLCVRALGRRDLDGALVHWRAGATVQLPGQGPITAPGGLRQVLETLLGAVPDLRVEELETTTYRERCVIHWRARGTFAGSGGLAGFPANGRTLDVEGAALLTVHDGQIDSARVFYDRAGVCAVLGLGDGRHGRRRRAATARIGARFVRPLRGGEARVIAPGVWMVSAHAPASMNVYLIAEPDGGVTVFDAGVASMGPAIAAAAARLGGLSRVILGHADCDHRGGAAGLAAPIFCHPLERAAAESAAHQRDYWDLGRLGPLARAQFPLLFRLWDGGPLSVAGTVAAGDRVGGFEVLDLPGHAPGLIGLFREEDGLAICSDVLYTLDVETGRSGPPRLPHPAFDQDVEQARRSLLALADREPRVVWVGHSHPVSGMDVPGQLRAAAEA